MQDLKKRGGSETSENLRGTGRSEFKTVTLKFRPIFCPKSGEEQKTKKKVFTQKNQILSHFLPNISGDFEPKA